MDLQDAIFMLGELYYRLRKREEEVADLRQQLAEAERTISELEKGAEA